MQPWEKESLEKLLEASLDNSIESMAKLTQTQWEMSSLSLQEGSAAQFLELFQKVQEPHQAVYLQTKYDALPLRFLLIFSRESSDAIVRTLASAYSIGLSPEESAPSVLQEVGNIMISSLLNQMAHCLSLVLFVTTPRYLNGRKRQLLESALAADADRGGGPDRVVLAHASMSSSKMSADCDLLILLSASSLREILSRLDGQARPA